MASSRFQRLDGITALWSFCGRGLYCNLQFELNLTIVWHSSDKYKTDSQFVENSNALLL